MADNDNAHVSINLNNGEMEIAGSEQFVERTIKTVFDFFREQRDRTHNADSVLSDDSDCKFVLEEQELDHSKADTNKYPNIFHFDNDGKVSILGTVPGSNNAEKTRNVALMILFVKKKIERSELVALCQRQACFDSKNFVANLDREKKYFIRTGDGKNWTLEITNPGLSAAEKLLEEISNG